MANNPQTNQAQQQNSTDAGANQGRFNIDIVAALVPKSRGGKIIAVILLLVLLFSYGFNFLHFRDLMKTFGFTLIGLITVVVMICFIIYGYTKWLKSNGEDRASFYIATALIIWMLDLIPEDAWLIGPLLGPEWAGFEWISIGDWTIPFVSVFFSAAFFSLMYISLILNIIEKEGWQICFGLIFIFLSNYIATKFFPNYINVGFSVPYPKISFLIVLGLIGIFGYFAFRADKKRIGKAFPEFFSSVFTYFVISFFLVNTGWQNNIRAWIHTLFIFGFGFGYIKPMERGNPTFHRIFIPVFLLIDFFGYGLLWSSDLLALRLIPPFVIVAIFYSYVKESNLIEGKRRATYPVLAFILLVTFILVMSINVAGIESEGTIPFVAKKGTTFQEIYSQFTNRFREAIEGRLDIATAGLYRGNVEKNRYESLGVYFGNIRAADPRFYTDEPITVWGSIRSKTYKDAVIINFSCYRWKDNKKIRADKIIPDIIFPIFTLEEIDTQCTFLPKTENPTPAGANIVTFSAEYNFGTDAYLKTYFIDRERFRASAREGIEPLTQFGIKDKTPAAVFTNGPVEIGLGAGPLVTVSEGYAVKPSIYITLTNRKEIQDKDKKIITRWEGKIKNITELILLTPPGITLGPPGNLEKCKDPKTDLEKLECPCSMPFSEYKIEDCFGSCTNNVVVPCTVACSKVGGSDENKNNCIKECQTAFDKCNEECTFLFKTNEGEGPTGEKYNAYALDVGSKQFKDLNKDIDKSRSFVCRFEPSSAVLDNSPITTRYFRVRARYNYLLENSVIVNVESLPVGVINTVPDSVVKTASEIRSGGPLWFDGFSQELIAAIASVESRFRHCCQDATKNRAGNCVDSGKKECSFGELITSGSSYGIMQIKYNTDESKKWVDSLSRQYCGKDSSGNDIKINNYDCNVKVGIAILKSKYDQFRYGCKATNEYKSRDIVKYKTFIDGCEKGISSAGVRYDSYRDYQAAIRGYNGWGRDSRFDVNYVEKVLNAMKTVKGTEIINPSTLVTITREGEGMFDATTTQDEQTSQFISPPRNIQGTYDPLIGTVRIYWAKPLNIQPTSYRVTRYVEDSAGGITEVAETICDNIQAEANRENFDCSDNSAVGGKTYTYSVSAYLSTGGVSEGKIKVAT